MNIAIRYYTKSGNTKKLAESIGNAINVPAKKVTEPLDEKVDVLFLGSSVYAAGVDQAVIDFIRKNKDKIGCIVNFSTAALLPSTYKQIGKVAEELGVKLSEKEFHCRGSFGPMHKGRPNEKDCAQVASFARSIVL